MRSSFPQLQTTYFFSAYLLGCFLYEVSASVYEMSEQQNMVVVVVVRSLQRITVTLQGCDWAAVCF